MPVYSTPCLLADARRPLRRWALALLAPVVAMALACTAMADDRDDDRNDDRNEAYVIGLWGDLPYSPVQATVGVPNLIADMNAQNLKFSVHDGDLKSGGSVCSDNVYTQSLGYFNALKAPAMFTPGDNDWTDCDRPSAGAYSSRERLDFERALFFSTPYSMGQKRMKQDVQPGALCLGVNGYVQCVKTGAGRCAASPTSRSTSPPRATTCATPRPIRPSTPAATRPTCAGCMKPSPTPKSAGQPP